MTRADKTLLWVEDGGADRFLYERACLEERGWTVLWSVDVLTAAKILTEHDLDGLIVDREMSAGRNRKSMWAGSHLIYWLRQLDPTALPDRLADDFNPWKAGLTPTVHNQSLEVVVNSAYDFDIEFAESMGLTTGIHLLDKPIDEDRLLDYIVMQEKRGA